MSPKKNMFLFSNLPCVFLHKYNIQGDTVTEQPSFSALTNTGTFVRALGVVAQRTQEGATHRARED
jgi:hypothetical protein